MNRPLDRTSVVTEFTEAGSGLTPVVDLRIPMRRDMKAAGWYSGNTHTHYHLPKISTSVASAT